MGNKASKSSSGKHQSRSASITAGLNNTHEEPKAYQPANRIESGTETISDENGNSGNMNSINNRSVNTSGTERQTTSIESMRSYYSGVDRAEAKRWNPTTRHITTRRGYHNIHNSEYVLPADADEQTRLNVQHFIFRAAFEQLSYWAVSFLFTDIICPAVRTLLLESRRPKILDVGCASGFWLRCVKRDFQFAECYGVDILSSNTQNLDVEDSTFDFVHQRAVGLGIPSSQSVSVLKELMRVTKPGGWIELVELDSVLYNPGPFSTMFIASLYDSLQERGLNSLNATDLTWCVQQVAKNTMNQETITRHIPVGWGSELGRLNGANVKAFMLGMEDWLHKTMQLSREEYRNLVEDCSMEWADQKTFAQTTAVYFQMKK
ncbi:hypothetical protein HK100_007620 [Physocladia obscura]|uniref:Methyltransferase domain-containing protein n=1 Tax=Physocladia obscura TaxID=109957 RepID=A0AAD5SP79_9FUNG|nr:hypothetical protein HK100_007620 [Physocladia obscura]